MVISYLLLAISALMFSCHHEVYNNHKVFNKNSIGVKDNINKVKGQRVVKRKILFYNLDVIIAVGYRVNSIQATHFRTWATQRFKEYIIKGFTLDEERLKNPDQHFDYFEDLHTITKIKAHSKIATSLIENASTTDRLVFPTHLEGVSFIKRHV